MISNDIYLSDSIDDLPKGIIVEHHYGDKLKNGVCGIFTNKVGYMGDGGSDYGDNVAYISIGKKANIVTLDSSYGYLYDKGIMYKKNESLYKKYGYDNLHDLFDHMSELYNPNIAFYEIQKTMVNLVKKENPSVNVIELLSEDEACPHQFLILDCNFREQSVSESISFDFREDYIKNWNISMDDIEDYLTQLSDWATSRNGIIIKDPGETKWVGQHTKKGGFKLLPELIITGEVKATKKQIELELGTIKNRFGTHNIHIEDITLRHSRTRPDENIWFICLRLFENSDFELYKAKYPYLLD